MSKYHFRLHRTITFRILASLLCVLIPMQYFGVTLFFSGYDTIAGQVNSISSSALVSLSEHVEKEIEVILSDLYEIERNIQLRQVTYPLNMLSATDYYTALKDIQDYLGTILNNNLWISEIRIYILHSKSFLSVIQEFNITSWGRYRHTAYVQSELDTLLERTRGEGANTLIWDETGPYVALLYPESSYMSAKKPYFAIQIRLNETELRNLLSARSVGDQESTAMLDLSSSKIIVSDNATLEPDVFSAFYESIRDQLLPYTGFFTYNDVDYFATACVQEKLDLVFINLVPHAIAMQSLKHYELGLVGYVLVSLLAFMLCTYLTLRMIRNPIQKLVRVFKEVEGGNYGIELPLSETSEEFVYLTNGFNHMSAKLNDTVNRLYKQEIYAQRMELNQLQMQINPHFLFNSYFMMDRLLQQGDYDVAAELSNCLGEYFRYINRDARRYVELSLEWNHMISYTRVQQLRYSRRLQLIVDPVPERYSGYIVPRLILQPLVENAVEHGLARTQSDGIAHLFFDDDEEYLHIIVEDNGCETTDELISDLKERLAGRDAPNQETSALVNIHRRLQLYYGLQYGIVLSRSALGGLRAEILLPARGKEDSDAYPEHSDRG